MDPEIRYTASGQAKAQLGIAVSRRWQNRQTNEWEERTSFFNVICWGDMAENVSDSVAKGTSLFCSGGTQQPTTNGGDYNTYELDVAPPVTGETNVYYLNSVISSENPHTSNVTQHLTFPIDYSATIKVTGGGMVTFKSYDSNCALVQNCGPTQGNMCQAPRTISLAGAMPAAPTTFMQPYQMPTGSYGQWVFFDITNVVAQ